MKLLLLLLPVCASAFFIPGLFRNKDKELNEHRSGKLSEEGKAKLAKMWGIDIEARKARLERINKKAAESLKKTLSKSELKESLKEIVPIKISNEKKVLSLLEVNTKSGIAEYLHQGDIHLSERQLDVLEKGAGKNRQKRLASAFANKWTNNTLFYVFDENSILKEQKTIIRAALTYIQENTCVSFVEDYNAENKVWVHRGDGCSSALGMEGGTQWLSLGEGCEVIGIAAHEFLHALGFDHTQTRSDRNTYVDVDLSDVNATWHGNFRQYPAAEDIIYVPYEYGSVMHYPANALVNTPGELSIVPHDGNYTYTLGNLLISFYDILMVNDHYGCNENCPADTSAVCQNGGYPNPRNCAVCNCPRGYGGALCDEIPAGCGIRLEASEEWQQFRSNVGDEFDHNMKEIYSICTDWITAPEAKLIQVRIIGMENEYCEYGCQVNGIEIKADANPNVTNPVYCCQEFNNRIISSSLNPTPIITYNRESVSSFDFEYRFLDPLTYSLVTVKKMVNDLDQHRYHSSNYYLRQWESQGFRENGEIGNILDPNVYENHSALFSSLCPSLVKLHTFEANDGFEYMTVNGTEAENLVNMGWLEIEPVGYCSLTRACGATGNLRSVRAVDGDMVYSTENGELNILNDSMGYQETLSPTICWLF